MQNNYYVDVTNILLIEVKSKVLNASKLLKATKIYSENIEWRKNIIYILWRWSAAFDAIEWGEVLQLFNAHHLYRHFHSVKDPIKVL